MKICHLLHRANHMNEDDFIKELFHQLLKREATGVDVTSHVALLESGVSRINVIIGILNSDEAVRLYSQPAEISEKESSPTVADKLMDLLALSYEDLVHHAYIEMLNRNPDSDGFKAFLALLYNGSPPICVISQILGSDEFRRLLESDRYYFTREILVRFLNHL